MGRTPRPSRRFARLVKSAADGIDMDFCNKYSIAHRLYLRRRCFCCRTVMIKKRVDYHDYYCPNCQHPRAEDGCCTGRGCGNCANCYGDCERCMPWGIYEEDPDSHSA